MSNWRPFTADDFKSTEVGPLDDIDSCTMPAIVETANARVQPLLEENTRLREHFLECERVLAIAEKRGAELAALKKEIKNAPVLYCDEAGNYFSTWSHDDYGVARTHTCRAVRRRPR